MRLLRLTGSHSVALGLISIRLRREAELTNRLQSCSWYSALGQNTTTAEGRGELGWGQSVLGHLATGRPGRRELKLGASA